jgi:hypothetical protein
MKASSYPWNLESIVGRSIKFLRIYDEGKLISMELGKYCNEVEIE